jgi:CheY-like chemotaxis protein/anti-sigma regulatory factor (Ser/Thr protein kinase)
VIKTATELAPDLPPIMGAESELREALTNLVINAVDAMPKGGTLVIATKVTESASDGDEATAERRVHVEVRDTGNGMDDDTRRRCLEPFYTTKGERGTGLGLAMVYGTVRRHSGDIEIESAIGKGTTVRLSFAAPGMVAHAPQRDAAPATPSRLRILIVDDDPVVLKALRDALEGEGHRVVAANGGRQGIEAFRAARGSGEPFTAVITDLGMPEVDGRQVASAVKAMSPATPVILLTGWGQRMAAEGDVPANVDRLVSKPPKLRELNAALAYCLREESA